MAGKKEAGKRKPAKAAAKDLKGVTKKTAEDVTGGWASFSTTHRREKTGSNPK